MAKSLSSRESGTPASAPPGKLPLVLASGSRYRAELLGRLRLDFVSAAPDIDETALAGEDAATLTQRLAASKARAVSALHPGHWILGSDQAAALGDRILGKPGGIEQAHAQLTACSGREVHFYTALALLREDCVYRALDITTVRFRMLEDAEIARYVAAEPALDCAGSFKCEGYGITLFEAIDSRDPTALIGLPLISLRRLLAQAGMPRP